MPNALLLCADSDFSESVTMSLATLGVAEPQIFTSWEECYAAIQDWGAEQGWLLLSCQAMLPGGFERLILTHDALEGTGGALIPSVLVEPDCTSEKNSVQQMLKAAHAINLQPLDGELIPPAEAQDALTADCAQALYELFGVETEYYEPPDEPMLAIGPDVVHQEMSFVSTGSLADLSLMELFYILYRRNAAGLLKLEKGARQIMVTVLGGVSGRQNSGDGADLSALHSALAWRDGTYTFAPKMIPGHSFLAFGKGLSPIYSGLQKLSTNQLAKNIDPLLGKYPAITSLIDEHGATFKKEPFFERFCEACSGRNTLEEVITVIGFPPGEILPWINFAIETDLLTLFEVPTRVGLIRMTYTLEDADPDWKPDLELPMTAEQRELYEELEYKHDYLKTNDAYVVFELEPGCGTVAAKEQYASLIKENHPDVYGGNIREEIKRLAEDVFILLKNSYEHIRSKESMGAPPSGPRPIRSSSSVQATSSPSVPARSSSGSLASSATVDPAGTSSGLVAPRAPRPRGPKKPKKYDLGLAKATSTSSEPAAPARARSEPPRVKNGVRTSASLPATGRPRPKKGSKPPPPRPSASRLKGPGGKAPESRKTPAPLPGKSRAALRRQFEPLDHFKNGQKYMRAQRYDLAAEAFRLASSMEEGNGKFKAHHAWATYMNNPNDASIMTMLHESTKLEGGARDSYLFLGQIAKKRDDHDKAYHFFKKVVEIDPECVEALREVRLHNMRKENTKGKSKVSSPDVAPKASKGKGKGKGKGSKKAPPKSFWARFKEALFKKR